jgi:serine/threonine-protein phosphatase 5
MSSDSDVVMEDSSSAAAAAAHPPPNGGASPADSETIAAHAALAPHDSPHPELLPQATPEQKAAAEKKKDEGNVLFGKCKYVAAREAYTAAIDLDPKNPVYYSNRAFCDLKLEEYGSALIDADKAIELDRTFVKAYYRRGAAHLALGKLQDARSDFRTVTKLKPGDKDAQTKLKDTEKQIYAAAFRKAIEGEATKPASETLAGSLEHMTVEDSYQGPRYVRGAIDLKFVTDLMEHFKNQRRLPKKYVYEILMDVLKVFQALPTMLEIEVAPEKKFTVCGDVHGQVSDRYT